MNLKTKALLQLCAIMYSLLSLSSFGVYSYDKVYGIVYFASITAIFPLITIVLYLIVALLGGEDAK